MLLTEDFITTGNSYQRHPQFVRILGGEREAND